MPTFTFHAYAGARQSGKTSAAHDAWAAYAAREEAFSGHRVSREQAAQFLPISGVIADPIEITAHDVETADPAELDALANRPWLPGVTTQTIHDTSGRRIVRVSSVPCVTTVGT